MLSFGEQAAVNKAIAKEEATKANAIAKVEAAQEKEYTKAVRQEAWRNGVTTPLFAALNRAIVNLTKSS